MRHIVKIAAHGWTEVTKMRYKVTGCRYETVEVEADSEDEAISKAFSELKSALACSGYIDDCEVEKMEETEDGE